ncbi:MAG: hypothetical protein IPQ07_09420 [Myxococcales bacterium]|nr:hypothetical protein [Myxococcales bacterium]
MRWTVVLFLLLGLAACGRLEFGGTRDAAALDGAGDSAAGDATVGLAPELVQATAFKTAGASSVAVIDLATPTRASSLCYAPNVGEGDNGYNVLNR